MNDAVHLAHRKAAGLMKDKEQLKRENKMQTKEIRELRDQIAIYK